MANESVNSRVTRIETMLDLHIQQNDKNWHTMFDLVNNKIMPAVEQTNANEKRMNEHIDGHWKFRAMALSVILAIGGWLGLKH